MENRTLSSFGFKIVDRNCPDSETLLRQAIEQQRPLEIGLYFKDEETLRMLGGGRDNGLSAVITHLDHRKLSVYSHLRHESLLREQIETSLALGAGYAINHIAPYPMSPRPDYQSLICVKNLK